MEAFRVGAASVQLTEVDADAARSTSRAWAEAALATLAADAWRCALDLVTIGRHCSTCGGGGHGSPRVHGPHDRIGHASISYTPGLIAVAFLVDRPGVSGQGLGIDIARVDLEAFAGVERTAMAGAELEHWRGLPSEAQLQALAQAWTAKEAILKASGEGLTRDPREVPVLGTRPRSSGIPWAPIPVPPGYAGAIAGS